MKKILATIVFAGIINSINAQSLIGKWQEQTPQVSAGYLNIYEFLDDSTFLFSPSQYFGLKRIVSIGGKYKYNKKTNSLTLQVEFTDERIGGTIERSDEGDEATDRWGIAGGKLKRIKLPKPTKALIVLEFKKSDIENSELILLDKQKFYKVQENLF